VGLIRFVFYKINKNEEEKQEEKSDEKEKEKSVRKHEEEEEESVEYVDLGGVLESTIYKFVRLEVLFMPEGKPTGIQEEIGHYSDMTRIPLLVRKVFVEMTKELRKFKLQADQQREIHVMGRILRGASGTGI